MRKWADWQYSQPGNWNGADNGVLQLHILQTVLPGAKAEARACDQIWHQGSNYETYMCLNFFTNLTIKCFRAYVTCVKVTLGANRLFPGKIRIYRRGKVRTILHNLFRF